MVIINKMLPISVKGPTSTQSNYSLPLYDIVHYIYGLKSGQQRAYKMWQSKCVSVKNVVLMQNILVDSLQV